MFFWKLKLFLTGQMFSFIFNQIFHEIICFFRRWYLERSEWFWSAVFAFLGVLDKNFAVAINVRLWLQPLYGDYSPVGRILGPILRTLRIVLGGLIYAIVLVIAGSLWLVWLLSIPVVVFLIFNSL